MLVNKIMFYTALGKGVVLPSLPPSLLPDPHLPPGSQTGHRGLPGTGSYSRRYPWQVCPGGSINQSVSGREDRRMREHGDRSEGPLDLSVHRVLCGYTGDVLIKPDESDCNVFYFLF